MVPTRRPAGHQGSLDPMFRLLADEQRRHLLYLLREHGAFPTEDLASVLAGWLAVRRGDGVATPTDRESVALRVHHVHLPKLVEAGVVKVDDDAGLVVLDDLPTAADLLLDDALDLEPETTAEAVSAATPEG